MKTLEAIQLALHMVQQGDAREDQVEVWLREWLGSGAEEHFAEYLKRTSKLPTQVLNRVLADSIETQVHAAHPSIGATLDPTQVIAIKNTKGTASDKAILGVDGLSEESRFVIRQPYAKGGLGVVFVARDRQLNRDVALKQIRSDRREDELLQSKFMLEAEITGQLEHPGVVPVYALGIDSQGDPFYAMRFIRGTELKEMIRRLHEKSKPGHVDYGGIEFRQLLKRFQDICNTIEYAHSRGILHRDLKPANVMLGSHGETLVVDWGLAKILSHPIVAGAGGTGSGDGHDQPIRVRSSADPSATQHGTFSGTVAYAPPEQLLGQLDRIGPRSDVYSLGAILFEVITNETPIQTKTKSIKEVVDAIRQGNTVDPKSRIADAPRPLSMICQKAMAFEPEDRYVSAMVLAEDIDRWLADERVLAIGDREPTLERLGRWLRRYRSWTIPIAAALLFSALVMGIGAFLINQARVAEKSAKESEKVARARESQNKKEAIDRNAIARDAIDTLLMESSNTLADFPATRDLQKRLLIAAAADYERLSRGSSEDELLQLERLRALVRVADIEAIQGNSDPSDRKYSEAIDGLEKMLPDLAGNGDALLRWRIELAKTIARRALAWDVGDRIDDSLKEFERSQAVWQEIHREDPDSTQATFLAARTQAQHANLLARARSAEASLRLLEEAIATFDKIAPQEEPRVPIERRKARESLARTLGMLGKYSDASGVLESIRQEVQASLSVEPTREDLETIARVDVSLANLHRSQGDFVAAAHLLEESGSHYAQLRSGWPDSMEYVENEANTYNDIGLLWLDRRSPKQAQAYLDRALNIFEQLRNNYPTIPRYAFALGTIRSGLGQVALKLEPDATIAIEHLSRSRELYQQLILLSPDSETIESLAATTGQLAQAYERSGAIEDAEAAFKLANDYYLQLIENRPGEPRYEYSLAEVEWRWGQCRYRTHQIDAARERFRSWLAHMQELVERYPDNAEYHHRLASGLLRKPDIFIDMESRAESHARRALVSQPSNSMFAITLAEACVGVDKIQEARDVLESMDGKLESESPEYQGVYAWLEEQSGNRELAISWFEKCQRTQDEDLPFDQEMKEWIASIRARISTSPPSQ